MPESPHTLVWLRRDLRLADNPALAAACADGGPVTVAYVHAPEEEAPWAPGAASRWWLHHALTALADDLARRGSRLVVRRGPSLGALQDLVAETGATALHWNRLYDPATRPRDERVKAWARAAGLQVRSHNASLLHEPWTLQTGKGDPYRVFTPYWKACLAAPSPGQPLPPPLRLASPPKHPASLDIAELGLLPRHGWDAGLAANWQPGEAAALAALRRFVDGAAADYGNDRDLPARVGTSRLSAHLHFGEIGPRQVLQACRDAAASDGLAAYTRQLYWREFAHHLLYHFPATPEAPLDARFADFPWRGDPAPVLHAWQRGHTGIPIVDAGMRELWHTGWMHNRVRMLTASLLTKNLLVPWQAGARWFWDTLVDADLANNTLGWQWTAGCGADAAPYFRIFNPALQGERFDRDGAYVRRWLPELRRLPERWIHQPWRAPAGVLAEAGVRPGRDYPAPIVDLAASRRQALALWDEVKRR